MMVADCSRPLSPEAGRAGAKCYLAEPHSHARLEPTSSKKIECALSPHSKNFECALSPHSCALSPHEFFFWRMWVRVVRESAARQNNISLQLARLRERAVEKPCKETFLCNTLCACHWLPLASCLLVACHWLFVLVLLVLLLHMMLPRVSPCCLHA